jgi:hypothetical protein
VYQKHWLSLRGSQYVRKVQVYCIIQLRPFEGNKWILGSNFLKSYDTIYDLDQLQIGISPTLVKHTQSLKPSPLKFDTDDYNQFIQFITIISICVFLVIVCLTTFFFYAKLSSKKKDQVKNKFDNPNNLKLGNVPQESESSDASFRVAQGLSIDSNRDK